MKRLFTVLALLFAAPALAVDNIQTCKGNSCAVQLNSRTSGGVSTQGIKVDATQTVTLGPSAGAVVHAMRGALDLTVGSSTGTPTYGLRHSGTNSLDFFTNSILALTIDSGNNVTLGASGTNTAVAGVFKVNGTGITNGAGGGLYWRSSASNQTCTTTCGTPPTGQGLNASSGNCVAAWNSSGNPSTCATSAANNFCMCAAIQ